MNPIQRFLSWSLRPQVLVIVLSGIALLSALTIYVAWSRLDEELRDDIAGSVAAFSAAVDRRLEARGEELDLALTVLVADREVVDAFASRDRAALAAQVVPLFTTTLQRRHRIDQLHFHLAPATSFLRAHRPEQFGDDLSGWRRTVVLANRERRPVIGLEVSRSGPGLKVVRPVVDGGRRLGSVEMATAVGDVYAAAAASAGVSYALGIDAEVWEASHCDDLLERLVEREGLVFFAASSPAANDVVSTAPRLTGRIRADGRTLASDRIAVTDFTGQPVGAVVVVRDVTARLGRFRRDLANVAGGILAVAALLAAVLGLVLQTTAFRPLRVAVHMAERLEAGGLDARLTPGGSREVAALGCTLNRMADRLQQTMNELSASRETALEASREADEARAVAEAGRRALEAGSSRMLAELDAFARGDLTVEVGEADESRLRAMFSAFDRAVAGIRRMVEEVASAASQTAGSAAEISASAESMARGAGRQRAATESVLAILPRVVTGAGTTVKVAAEAERLSRRASEAAQQGARRLHSTEQKMESIDRAHRAATRTISGLTAAVEEIEDVTSLIDGIAKQTRLLALNAAVQASNAGEHGRAFSVVADEIARFAERTAQTAQTITAITERIVRRTAEAEHSVETAAEVIVDGRREMGDMVAVLKSLFSDAEASGAIVQRVSAAGERHVAEIGEALQEVGSIADFSEQMAGSTEQVAQAAADLARLADNLELLVRRFRL